MTLLVDDRVESNGGLAGLAIADDQLALAAADRDQGVDRLDTGLHRLVHRLASSDTGGLDLHAALLNVAERTLPVNWFAERVDYPSEQAVSYRNREDVAGGYNCLAFDYALHVTKYNGTDGFFVEVEG